MINNLQRVFASGLSGVDDVADYVAKYKAHLRSEMAQLEKDTQAHHLEVPQANARAAKIVSDIAQLRERADTTEGQITGMTAAIKRLDDAKQNLVTSITVLKRLQMLSTAYDQLVVLVDRRDYEDVVPHLAAVNELMAYFKPYRTIDHIAELSKRVTETESQLGEKILEDFQKALDGSSNVQPSSLVSACSVLDVIGNGFPQRLQDWYTNTQLKGYRTIFSASDEAGSLDNIATRFSFFGDCSMNTTLNEPSTLRPATTLMSRYARASAQPPGRTCRPFYRASVSLSTSNSCWTHSMKHSPSNRL